MNEMEEEMKKAYETLGLPEDATREQVENRYFILMKRERSQQQRAHDNDNANGESAITDLGEINRAYRLILGLESEKTSTEPKQGKIGHFFYYYKIHIIVAVVILLFVGYTIKDSIDKRNAEAKLGPIDLSVSVMGNFYFADMEIMQKNLLKLTPDWNRIKATLTYIPVEIKSQQDIAMQQKSVLTLISEKDQLYFLDKKNFDSLVQQEVFHKLDELPGFAALQVPADRLRFGQTDKDTKSYAYGIDVTDNPIFEGIEMNGERVIVAVRAKEEEWPKTMQLLTQILKTNP
ncbi:hypothetical protein [Cohnella yongneupensis]|uniref:J domain-containing protein n=1 Tax=Cohnella yongneupensis TaxID=425006 RepID=A0ABW0R3J1_9BACL